MTPSRAQRLNLFRAITGRTTIKAPVIHEDLRVMTGYMPAKVREIRKW